MLLHTLTYICERKEAGKALPLGHMQKQWRARRTVSSLRCKRCNRPRCWRQTVQK
ncbi:rCG38553 [Rattus norvegicus]|uniref:RCG38553 n=1 Tax=Rattus norvegicus TaxID=10116 RepID=A6KLY5_RAT|nr:rCG38553 [Rattus norvegicus]